MKKRTESNTRKHNGKSLARAWVFRFFHTIFMFFGAYFVLIFTALNIPTIIPFILGGMGFSVTSGMSNAEYIVAFCAGIFLTAWLVIGDFLIIRAAWRLYKKNIKKTITKREKEYSDESAKD